MHKSVTHYKSTNSAPPVHTDMLCVCKDAFVRHQSLHECLRSQLIHGYLWHLLRTSELPPEAGCQAAMADCYGQNNRSMPCDVQIFSTAATRLTARVWLLSGTINSAAAALQLHPSIALSYGAWRLLSNCSNTIQQHSADIKQPRLQSNAWLSPMCVNMSLHTAFTHTHTYVQTLLGFHWSED